MTLPTTTTGAKRRLGDGLRKIREGVTSAPEVLRVLGSLGA